MKKGGGTQHLLAGLLATSCLVVTFLDDVTSKGEDPPGEASNSLTNPFAGNGDAITEGRNLFFKYGCNVCHGGTGGGGMCPSLINDDWVYGSDDETLFNLVRKGSLALGRAKQGEIKFRAANMPPIGAHMSDEEIWKVLAFVRSQHKDNTANNP